MRPKDKWTIVMDLPPLGFSGILQERYRATTGKQARRKAVVRMGGGEDNPLPLEISCSSKMRKLNVRFKQRLFLVKNSQLRWKLCIRSRAT